MTARARLPSEAYDYYVGLGTDRTYRAVAQHFGVSKRSVTKRASADRWQARLSAMLRGARTAADRKAGQATHDNGMRHATRLTQLQDALHEVVNAQRFKAVVAAILKAAVQGGDMGAARFLIERLLGKPRGEPLPATAIDLPDGLETACDVKVAANTLLQGVADGSLSPEDAQKTAAVIESARRAIETEDLAKRIAAIEENIKKEKER